MNNYLGWQSLEYLRQQEEIVAVVVHPPEQCRFESEIRKSAMTAGAEIITAEALRTPEGLKKITALRPNMGMSVMFGYLLKPEFLALLPHGCLNLHPSFLPYNRGTFPNVWSIVDGTPAGVTLHYVDEGVDTGDIICQRRVPVSCTDTGETLYRKLESAGLELLRETWPAIRNQEITRVSQQNELGTYHRLGDVAQIDEIDLQKTYKAGDLLNILRARTFPPYHGAFFRHDGRKVYMRIQFEEHAEDESKEKSNGTDPKR
jgi:methionyl-tRNA formyltransferase